MVCCKSLKPAQDIPFQKLKGKVGLSFRGARMYLEQGSRSFASGDWVSVPSDGQDCALRPTSPHLLQGARELGDPGRYRSRFRYFVSLFKRKQGIQFLQPHYLSQAY